MLSDEKVKAGKTRRPLHFNGTISIIIVTYNAAATLQNCLNSIYQQAHPDLEIVVIDGKSTDDTTDIIQNNKTRITFYKSEADNGVYDAMNKAVNYAKGNWIYFLGADDVLFQDFSLLANELEDNNAIYYGSVLTKGLKRFGKVSPYYMAKIGVFHQAIVYPAWVFKKYHYDEKYKVFADYALNMQCFKDKNIKWVFKDYIIANFNHTGLSATQQDDVFEKDKSGLIRENFGMLIWLRFLIKQLKGYFKN